MKALEALHLACALLEEQTQAVWIGEYPSRNTYLPQDIAGGLAALRDALPDADTLRRMAAQHRKDQVLGSREHWAEALEALAEA